MARKYRQDVERDEFSIRQRGTADAIQLKASASSRHRVQQDKIDELLPLSKERRDELRAALLKDQQEFLKKELSEDERELLYQQELLRPAFVRHWGLEKNLCLFNIIVAFEWMPNYNDLRLLREATTSASALLYDVTDGYMAIGRVCVGGPELMECADFQIFASNRLFPRSTVDGFNEPHKYQPIRLGRGLWHKNSRITLPWDSELGFATLIHEWGHYALGLKDQYLEVKTDKKVVIPVRNPVRHTIMAGPDKDELLATNLSEQASAKSEWLELSKHSTFTWLEIEGNHTSQELPPPQQLTPAFRLIGELRKAAMEEENIAAKGQANGNGQQHDDRYEQPHPILCWEHIENTTDPNDKISPDHCWVYVVGGDIDNPTKLIAQGEVEQVGALIDHTIDGPALRLLGAVKNDLIVLVGHRQSADEDQNTPLEPLILWAQITAIKDRNKVETSKWENVTPGSMPRVAVQLSELQIKDGKPPTHTLKFKPDTEDWEVHICPFGEQEKLFPAETKKKVTSLDGHVLLVNRSGRKPVLAIAGYSLGGSPDSGFPVHPNPIPAGSADGNAMIFFYNPAEVIQQSDTGGAASPQMSDTASCRVRCHPPDYVRADENRQRRRLGLPVGQKSQEELDKYRIVVTTNYQTQEDQSVSVEFLGDPNASSSTSTTKKAQPRSYTFGIATNQSLAPLKPNPNRTGTKQPASVNTQPIDYLPTLVLYYDNKALLYDATQAVEKGQLVIARYDPDEEKWIAWTPEVSQDSVAALPLNSTTAPGLFLDNEKLKPEYFRLFLITE